MFWINFMTFLNFRNFSKFSTFEKICASDFLSLQRIARHNNSIYGCLMIRATPKNYSQSKRTGGKKNHDFYTSIFTFCRIKCWLRFPLQQNYSLSWDELSESLFLKPGVTSFSGHRIFPDLILSGSKDTYHSFTLTISQLNPWTGSRARAISVSRFPK